MNYYCHSVTEDSVFDFFFLFPPPPPPPVQDYIVKSKFGARVLQTSTIFVLRIEDLEKLAASWPSIWTYLDKHSSAQVLVNQKISNKRKTGESYVTYVYLSLPLFNNNSNQSKGLECYGFRQSFHIESFSNLESE